MRTNKWFYELFLSQPGMLAELLPGIETSWAFSYSAPVLKEQEFRLDGVFTPLSDDPMIPIVFVEAQMQTDKRFVISHRNKEGNYWEWEANEKK